MTTCPECNGKGYCDADYPSSNRYQCLNCNGDGEVEEEGVDFWICEECGTEFGEELEDGLCEECKDLNL